MMKNINRNLLNIKTIYLKREIDSVIQQLLTHVRNVLNFYLHMNNSFWEGRIYLKKTFVHSFNGIHDEVKIEFQIFFQKKWAKTFRHIGRPRLLPRQLFFFKRTFKSV